jgi:hypothetical protein
MHLDEMRWGQMSGCLSYLLIVCYSIDDFQARSSDELSLTKNDRVELIERDDEFGDGWFLGRHLANGNTGLFPEGSPIWPFHPH